jgi:hypothetical protein
LSLVMSTCSLLDFRGSFGVPARPAIAPARQEHSPTIRRIGDLWQEKISFWLNSADPAAIIAGDLATAADIAKIRDKLGLNEPLWLQFRRWASSLAVGGLGGG